MRSGIAPFRERLKARFPGRYESNLGHRKEAVHDDQQEDDREVQGQHRDRLSRLRPTGTLAPSESNKSRNEKSRAEARLLARLANAISASRIR
jgi:hypothetical protein